MFLVAAEALAARVSDDDLACGLVYPPIGRIHEVAVEVAVEVARAILDAGLARVDRPDDLASFVRAHVYDPSY